jgi:glutathione S-transferase
MIKADPKDYNGHVKDLKDAVKFYDTHLKGKNFFVGESLTLADLRVASLLSLAF